MTYALVIIAAAYGLTVPYVIARKLGGIVGPDEASALLCVYGGCVMAPVVVLLGIAAVLS
jgi:hypothetical protein